jgi:hypothetical protein
MSSAGQSEDTYRARLQAVIASLRYWIPSVADAARVEEMETADFWKMGVLPRVAGACPFELLLRSGDRRLDLAIAGEIYEDLDMLPFEDFQPLVEAISEGRVLQRSWISPVTAAPIDHETVVTFANGKVWRGQRARGPASSEMREAGQVVERHFLPYRRER